MAVNLAGFLFFLKDRKRSTVRNYNLTLNRLVKECKVLNYHKAQAFLTKLKNEGKRGSYINKFVDCLRLWGQYTHDRKLAKFPFFKEEIFIKATMSDEEIEAFLNLSPIIRKRISKSGKLFYSTCDPDLYKVWTLFFGIMAFTGMRPGEVAHLKVEDVDFGRSVFILEDTKTNEPRFVPIPPNLSNDIKQFLSRIKSEYLFASRRGGDHNGEGKVFDSIDWFYNFHTRIKRLGITRRNLSVYSLRHSFITRMLEEDVNIFKVQKIVGHHRIDTTAQYEHLTTKDICESIKRLPLIKKTLSPLDKLNSIKEVIQRVMGDSDGLAYHFTNNKVLVKIK